MTLGELAGAVPMEIVRDGEFRTVGLLSSRTPELLAYLYDGRAARECRLNPDLACVITSAELADGVPEHLGLALAAAPQARFADAQRFLIAETDFYGPTVPTEVAPDAAIHPAAVIAPCNVRIEAGCVVEAGAVVLDRTTLEAGAVVRAGAVIGAEGFHPVTDEGRLSNLSHGGGVRIGSGVQVLSNAVVCRAAFQSPTDIGARSLIGPLSYIAHGVRTGTDCRLAASVRIAGGAVLGHGVFVGPNAVVANGIRVGDRARISLGAVVVRDVEAGQTVTGHFAIEHGRFLSAWKRLVR